MQKTVTLPDSMDGLATVDNNNNASFCRLGGPSAQLTLWWEPKNSEITEAAPRRMSFNFSAVSSSGSGGLTCFCVTYDIMYT